MADVYASAVGTTVLQLKEIPPRPAEYDGALCLFGRKSTADEAALRASLGRFGLRTGHDGCELDTDPAVVRFDTHEAALAAKQAAPWAELCDGVDTQYNERSYDGRHHDPEGRADDDGRGWCCFEGAVSDELLARLHAYPAMLEELNCLPPKLLVLRADAPAEAAELRPDNLNARVNRVGSKIQQAVFTGKADVERVPSLYKNYVERIVNMLQKTLAYALPKSDHSAAGTIAPVALLPAVPVLTPSALPAPLRLAEGQLLLMLPRSRATRGSPAGIHGSPHGAGCERRFSREQFTSGKLGPDARPYPPDFGVHGGDQEKADYLHALTRGSTRDGDSDEHEHAVGSSGDSAGVDTQLAVVSGDHSDDVARVLGVGALPPGSKIPLVFERCCQAVLPWRPSQADRHAALRHDADSLGRPGAEVAAAFRTVAESTRKLAEEAPRVSADDAPLEPFRKRSKEMDVPLNERLDRVRRGMKLTKYNLKDGKSKVRWVRLEDNARNAKVVWSDAKSRSGTSQLHLSSAMALVHGAKDFVHGAKLHQDWQCFSIVTNERTLDLACETVSDLFDWYLALASLLPQSTEPQMSEATLILKINPDALRIERDAPAATSQPLVPSRKRSNKKEPPSPKPLTPSRKRSTDPPRGRKRWPVRRSSVAGGDEDLRTVTALRALSHAAARLANITIASEACDAVSIRVSVALGTLDRLRAARQATARKSADEQATARMVRAQAELADALDEVRAVLVFLQPEAIVAEALRVSGTMGLRKYAAGQCLTVRVSEHEWRDAVVEAAHAPAEASSSLGAPEIASVSDDDDDDEGEPVQLTLLAAFSEVMQAVTAERHALDLPVDFGEITVEARERYDACAASAGASHLSMALNPWNHAPRQLPAADFVALFSWYRKSLEMQHSHTSDVLSGEKLDVLRHCIAVGVAGDGAELNSIKDAVSLAKWLRSLHGDCTSGRAIERPAAVLLTAGAAAGKTVLLSQVVRLSSDGELVPILIKVQRLQRLLRDAPDVFANTWNFVDALLYIEHAASRPALYLALRQALMARRALLLIDGLDEGGARHEEIERHVTEVLAQQGHVMLCTSRPSGFDEYRFAGFRRLTLAPMSVTQQEDALKKRLGQRKAAELKPYLARVPRATDLASNPLMLSMVCSVFKLRQGLTTADGIAMPSTTAELYETASDAMLSRNGIATPSLRKLLQAIFFEAHVAQRRIIQEVQLEEAALGLDQPEALKALRRSALMRQLARPFAPSKRRPHVGHWVKVLRGKHRGKCGIVTEDDHSNTPFKVRFWDQAIGDFDDSRVSGDLEPMVLCSSGLDETAFLANAMELVAADVHRECAKLSAEMKQALRGVRRRVASDALPLLEIVQLEPLQVQSSHLSFQEYFAARSLCEPGTRLSGTMPWRWPAWWANTIAIGEGMGAEFGRGLLRATGLEGDSLDLSEKLGGSRTTALRAVTQMAMALRTLTLDENSLRAEGAAHLGEALQGNTSLTELHLRANRLDGAAARHLGRGLRQNATLLSLDLSSNSLGPEGAGHLAAALKDAWPLTSLDLSDNMLTSEGRDRSGLRKLCDALPHCKLATLRLRSNELGLQGAELLKEGLSVSRTMTAVDLQSNQIGAEGAALLAEAATSNVRLAQIDLRGNGIDELAKAQLKRTAGALQQSSAGRVLVMGGAYSP